MECMKDQFLGDQLLDGRFRTITPLNHGSFGMVFLAEDLFTKKDVAIKCLTKHLAAPPDLQVAFDEGADELECHAVLNHHPHLVNLVHHFETAAHNYLILEYCSQGDLYEAIRQEKGPLETEHVRRFMLQLIGAVEHMHKHSLYHRDIKPENIFLTANGDVKLGDFGLATRNSWSYEACVGSDRYMAPEQYDHLGNGYAPAQADVWSIGICLLNILFARNPFVTPTESDVLFADYVRDRQSLFDIFPNMSNDTYGILSIALSIDPTKRDLQALRLAIERAHTFTIDDEDLDDFCTERRDVIQASANREPLRTPSIQTPQVETGAFPWSTVLHTTPAKPTQMPSIPDEYEEDMFSEYGNNDAESWYSGRYNTPSNYGSTFGTSFQSMKIPARAFQASRPRPSIVPSSLPVQRSRPVPAMSQIFGKKDTVAKSWSDMYEEDEEAAEREAALRSRQDNNARGFSHESAKEVATPCVLREKKSLSSLNVQPRTRHTARKVLAPIRSSLVLNENDPFAHQPKTPKRSPKYVPMDKWAELGDRRRNPVGAESAPPATPAMTKKRSMTQSSMTGKKRSGSTAQDSSSTNRRQSRNKSNKSRPSYLDKDWRQQKVIDSSEDEDSEWVGGWQHFHL